MGVTLDGLRHLYIEQGSQQTATFMRHYRHGSRICRALRVGLSSNWSTVSSLTHSSIPTDCFHMLSDPVHLNQKISDSIWPKIHQTIVHCIQATNTWQSIDGWCSPHNKDTNQDPTKKSTALPQGGMPLRNMNRQWTLTPRILVDPKTIYGVANREVVAHTEPPRQDGMYSLVRVH
jgi:hypothetical protein